MIQNERTSTSTAENVEVAIPVGLQQAYTNSEHLNGSTNSQPSSSVLQLRCHTEKRDSRHISEHTDVLALDNTKRNPISSLTIIAQTPANAVSPASCTVEFTGGTKAKLSGTARDAISLSVDGQDPIAKAETFAAIEEQVERALASPLPVVFVAVSLVVLLLIGLFTMGGLRAMPLSSNVGLHSSELPELDQKAEEAKTADAKLSFLFELKRREIHSLAKVYAPVHWGELATFSGVLKTIAFGGLIAMLFYMLAFCYPMNVFLWGDYDEHYAVLKERRKVIRNIIVVGVGVAVFVNILSSELWHHYHANQP